MTDAIAAAVNGHVKALRLLGHQETTMAHIADSLGLTDGEVEAAFANYKIVGAAIHPKTKRSHVRHGTTFSPLVDLKRLR